MDVSDYIGFVASEGDLFASAAEQGELSVDIPPCPGWDMRALVRHLGLIHLWAAGHVAFPHEEPEYAVDLHELASYWPDLAGAWPDDAGLVAWYRDTHANLVEVLKAADPDVAAFTFLPAPSPLAMWGVFDRPARSRSTASMPSCRGASPRTSTHGSPPTCSTNWCPDSDQVRARSTSPAHR